MSAGRTDYGTSRATPPPGVANNPVLRVKAWNRMNIHNDNWMAATVGPTGSGKSWASLRIAETLDPNFTVDQVAFGVLDFMKLVMDDSYGRGSLIVFEEASVEANAQEWFSASNRVLRQVADTWRHQNRGAIFTLPAFGQLQKQARGRMSALIQMTHKVEDEGYTLAKYKWCDQDSDTGKIYKKYPVIKGKKYKRLKIRPPSPELVEAYEERKAAYTDGLNKELFQELLEDLEDDDEEEEKDPRDIARDIMDEGIGEDYVGDNYGQLYIDRDLIEMDYDIGRSKSKKVSKLLQQKGLI